MAWTLLEPRARAPEMALRSRAPRRSFRGASWVLAVGLVACGGPRPAPAGPPTPARSAPAEPTTGAATQDTPAEPARDAPEAAPPLSLDASFPAPMRASVIGVADGVALLDVTGMGNIETPWGPGLGTYDYYAELDLESMCLTETHGRVRHHAANATGTIDEALAALRDPATRAELAHLQELAARFGVRRLTQLAVGPSTSLLEANNQIYLVAGDDVRHVGPTALLLAVSDDGARVAYRHCGSPCGGRYVPAVMDVATGRARQMRGSTAEAAAFASDGTLYFVTSDRTRHHPVSQLCLRSMAVGQRRLRRVACWPLQNEHGAGPTFSADARYLTLGMTAGGPRAGRLTLVEVPSGRLMREVDAEPIWVHASPDGRLAYRDRDRAAVLDTSAGQTRRPGLEVAGFLPDGGLLVFDPAAGDGVVPVTDRACGRFRRW